MLNSTLAHLPTPLTARSAHRLGKPSEDQCRPLKAIFDSKKDARSLLTATTFLDSHKLKAKSDLTPNQLKHLQDQINHGDENKKWRKESHN